MCKKKLIYLYLALALSLPSPTDLANANPFSSIWDAIISYLSHSFKSPTTKYSTLPQNTVAKITNKLPIDAHTSAAAENPDSADFALEVEPQDSGELAGEHVWLPYRAKGGNSYQLGKMANADSNSGFWGNGTNVMEATHIQTTGPTRVLVAKSEGRQRVDFVPPPDNLTSSSCSHSQCRAKGSLVQVRQTMEALTPGGIRPAVFDRAMNYLESNRKKLSKTRYVGMVDYCLPVSTPRFFIYDTVKGEVVLKANVSHGAGSGAGAIPTKFGNQSGKSLTSLGCYRIERTKPSKFGSKAALMTGLEQGLNSRVVPTSGKPVEIHPWWGVDPQTLRLHDNIGYPTEGCFGVEQTKADQVIEFLQDGGLLCASSCSGPPILRGA